MAVIFISAAPSLLRLARCRASILLARGEKQPGIGMLKRAGAQPVSLHLLDDLAGLHHAHAVAHMGDHGEIVADQQIGQPPLLAQFLQQVQDFRLNRHVEGRCRLVEQQHFRLQDQRAGDGDALALAAGELMRKTVAQFGIEPDRCSAPRSPLPANAAGPGCAAAPAAARGWSCADAAIRRGPGTPSAPAEEFPGADGVHDLAADARSRRHSPD